MSSVHKPEEDWMSLHYIEKDFVKFEQVERETQERLQMLCAG